MKIISGTLGGSGSVVMDDDGLIGVNGDMVKVYDQHEVVKIRAWIDEEQKFGIAAMVVIFVSSVFLSLVFGVIGFLVGLAWIVYASNAMCNRYCLDILFDNGNKIIAEGSHAEIKRFRSLI